MTPNVGKTQQIWHSLVMFLCSGSAVSASRSLQEAADGSDLSYEQAVMALEAAFDEASSCRL